MKLPCSVAASLPAVSGGQRRVLTRPKTGAFAKMINAQSALVAGLGSLPSFCGCSFVSPSRVLGHKMVGFWESYGCPGRFKQGNHHVAFLLPDVLPPHRCIEAGEPFGTHAAPIEEPESRHQNDRADRTLALPSPRRRVVTGRPQNSRHGPVV